jgi:hypothetical protein
MIANAELACKSRLQERAMLVEGLASVTELVHTSYISSDAACAPRPVDRGYAADPSPIVRISTQP